MLNRQYTFKVIKPILLQVLYGLEYLHSMNLMHRNINPDDILLNDSGVVKLGEGSIAPNLLNNVEVMGIPEYMAPEMFMEDYNEKVDIYALGITLLEIVTDTYPYTECTSTYQIFNRVTHVCTYTIYL
jgi:WNK lysine deficient protein kinase